MGIIKIVSYKYCQVCHKLLKGNQRKFCSRKCSFHDYAKRVKLEVFTHYCEDYQPYCQICGIQDLDVLVLHHVNNDGNKHREEVPAGYNLHLWLRRNNYPNDYILKVLCANCNMKLELIERKPKEE